MYLFTHVKMTIYCRKIIQVYYTRILCVIKKKIIYLTFERTHFFSRLKITMTSPCEFFQNQYFDNKIPL